MSGPWLVMDTSIVRPSGVVNETTGTVTVQGNTTFDFGRPELRWGLDCVPKNYEETVHN